MNARTTFTLLLSLAGCAPSLSAGARALVDADVSRVRGCASLGIVTGDTQWGGPAGDKGAERSKDEVREQAARLGATHLVWLSTSSDLGSMASANAYRCPAASN
jgi:hypothetical protein